MKNKRIVKIIAFIFVILLLSINKSYAAIEIKDTTEAVFTNKTISEFYDMTEEMRNPGQGLEGSNVDVKMANNYEWAAVSYFSNSIYGTATAGQNKGVQLENSTHLSTNGNITGIMDWGKTQSFTAGIISSYNNEGVTLTTSGGQSIINAAKNPSTTNRIDKFENIYWRGQDLKIAATSWYGDTWIKASPEEPYAGRVGLFIVYGGDRGFGSGDRNPNYTFRPVFYAQ